MAEDNQNPARTEPDGDTNSKPVEGNSQNIGNTHQKKVDNTPQPETIPKPVETPEVKAAPTAQPKEFTGKISGENVGSRENVQKQVQPQSQPKVQAEIKTKAPTEISSPAPVAAEVPKATPEIQPETIPDPAAEASKNEAIADLESEKSNVKFPIPETQKTPAEIPTQPEVQPEVKTETPAEAPSPAPVAEEIPKEAPEVQPEIIPDPLPENPRNDSEESGKKSLVAETQETSRKIPTQPEVQPEVNAETPKKAPTPITETETQTNEVANEAPQMNAEDGEIIAGDIPKPGDKVESIHSFPVSQNPNAETDKIASAQNPFSAGGTEFKTGFKPDGVTPLDAEEKLFSAIGYISFLALLPFLTRKDSEFAQHHGRQSLVIFAIVLVLALLLSFSSAMPGLAGILTILVAIGGGALAYKGDWFKVPGIYDLSLKLKTLGKAQEANPKPQVEENFEETSDGES